MAALQSLLFCLLALVASTWAQSCASYAANEFFSGQTYNIPADSDEYFTFQAGFEYCQPEAVQARLVSPSGNLYSCSELQATYVLDRTAPPQSSTCYIPFSQMEEGMWTIVLQAPQNGLESKREFTLIPTIVVLVTTTQTETSVEATTIAEEPSTIYSPVITQAETWVLPTQTITTDCATEVQTVTSYAQQQSTVITQTLTRTEAGEARTESWTTTVTSMASCHYANGKRDVAATSTETSIVNAPITVTTTIYTTSVIPASTLTEPLIVTSTVTSTPAPNIVCAGNPNPTVVVTVIPPGGTLVTATSWTYTTEYEAGTVWVGHTEYTTVSDAASASACWRAGGWYGR